MDAELLLDRKDQLAVGVFQQLVVWRVPTPARGSTHPYKYRLALVADEVCVMRYDNEAGKGDHRHWGNEQLDYAFTSLAQLLADFDADVDRWMDEHSSRER
jgi:hypothetical protein